MEHATYQCPPGCGLCCSETLIEANALDVLREPRIDVERPIKKRAKELHVLSACWILGGPGTPCAFLNGEKRCGIYPTRPNVCVQFAAGSARCTELRVAAGLLPLEAAKASGIVAEIGAAMAVDQQQEDEDW